MHAQTKAPPVAVASPAKIPTRQNTPAVAATAQQNRDINGTQNTQEWFQYARYLGIQAKLDISQPNDPDEQEADRVADRIMRMAAPGPISSSGGNIQRKDIPGHATQASSAIHSQIGALRGGGQPLAPSVRAFFEPSFGHNFSGVRVHSYPAASEGSQQIGARAFTLGQDVAFAAGEFEPASTEGKRLLAHELTHVVQQEGGHLRVQADGKLTDADMEAVMQWIQATSPEGSVPSPVARRPTPFPGVAHDRPFQFGHQNALSIFIIIITLIKLLR